jgi:hypothetical protein
MDDNMMMMVHPVPGGVSRGAPSNGRGPVHGRRVKAIKEASSVISSSCANMTRGVACRGRDCVVWSSPILGCFLPLLSSAGRTKLVPAVLVTTRNLDFSFRVRGDR